MSKKLCLGCGPLPLHHQHLSVMGNVGDWVLVDKYIRHPLVKNWDATNLVEVNDGTIEAIYASHLLEHLPHTNLFDILSMWKDKLKPDGELILNVPDLVWAAKRLLQWESGQLLDGVYHTFEGERGLQVIFYGSHEHDGEVHKAGFTERSLGELLERVGFTDITITKLFDAHDMGVLFATAKKGK